jgi:hypothetical protein
MIAFRAAYEQLKLAYADRRLPKRARPRISRSAD